MKISENQREVGALLAAAVDVIKDRLVSRDRFAVGVVMIDRNDPENSFLVGDMKPDQIIAGMRVLLADGEHVGHITAGGSFTEGEA